MKFIIVLLIGFVFLACKKETIKPAKKFTKKELRKINDPVYTDEDKIYTSDVTYDYQSEKK